MSTLIHLCFYPIIDAGLNTAIRVNMSISAAIIPHFSHLFSHYLSPPPPPLVSQYSIKGCTSDLNKLPSSRPGELVRRPSTFLAESSYTLLLFAIAKGLTEVVRVLITSAEMVTQLDEVKRKGEGERDLLKMRPFP